METKIYNQVGVFSNGTSLIKDENAVKKFDPKIAIQNRSVKLDQGAPTKH